MGGKKSAKRVIPKKKPTVAKFFKCPFCGHDGSVGVKVRLEVTVSHPAVILRNEQLVALHHRWTRTEDACRLFSPAPLTSYPPPPGGP